MDHLHLQGKYKNHHRFHIVSNWYMFFTIL